MYSVKISLEFGPKYFRNFKLCSEKTGYGLNETIISRLYHENISKRKFKSRLSKGDNSGNLTKLIICY